MSTKTVSVEHTFHEEDVVPVRYGRVCTSCQRLLPVKAFEHVRYRTKAKPGLANPDGTKLKQVQEWRECTDCTRAAGRERKTPPPHKMRHADIRQALDEGRLHEHRAYGPGGLLERADQRVRQEQQRAMRAYQRKLWADPFRHAINHVATELVRIHAWLQYLGRQPYPVPQQHTAMVIFGEAYRSALQELRECLRQGASDETARADRWWVKYLSARTSEHYMTNTRVERPRGRPPAKQPPAIRWASVCLPDSRWADYLPAGELDYLHRLYADIDLVARARRMRVVPLLLDPTRQHPLADYVPPHLRKLGEQEARAAAWLQDRQDAARAELPTRADATSVKTEL